MFISSAWARKGSVFILENAQELIQRLNHSGKKLSKSHRRIAECIVSHYDKVVFMTASKLGEYVGVSESTVVRFAAALGYSGYPQLQKALQELIRHRLTASQRFEMTSDMDHAQVLNKVLKADIMNIRSTLDELDLNAFEKAIDRIIQARAIYVLGLRASAPIAEFFVHYLKYIFTNVTVVTSGISDVFEQLSRIGEGDLLIGISLLHLAHHRGHGVRPFARGFAHRHHRRAALAFALHGGRLPDGQERHGLVRRFLRRAALAHQRPHRRPQPAAAAGGLRALRGTGKDLGQLRRLSCQERRMTCKNIF